MRAREAVIAWLTKLGKTPPDKKRRHVEFAADLCAILEPRSTPSFKGKREAAAYVQEVAQMVGGRDCLSPPRPTPLQIQKRETERRIGRRQRVFDSRRKAQQHRVEAKIAKSDREIAERMALRRAETQHQDT
jgi:hypothetical protein